MRGHEPTLTGYSSAPLRTLLVLAILAAACLLPVAAAAKGHDLRDASVSPRSGTKATVFHLAVTLKDRDDSGPVVAVVGGIAHAMVRSSCDDCDHDETRYTFDGTVLAGTHSVLFESQDEDKHASDALFAGWIQVSGVTLTPKPVATPKPTKTPKPDKKTPKAAKTPEPATGPKAHATPKPPKAPKPSSVPSQDTFTGVAATQRPTASPGTPALAPAKPERPSPEALGGGSVFQLGLDQAGGQNIVLDDIRLTSGFSTYAWLVPGFALGLPGLFVLLVIGLQLAGATIFVPLTRRLLSRQGRRRS